MREDACIRTVALGEKGQGEGARKNDKPEARARGGN
jgi:hypothetical protein